MGLEVGETRPWEAARKVGAVREKLGSRECCLCYKGLSSAPTLWPMLLGSVLETCAVRPLGAKSDPTHPSSAAGASLWCTRQRNTRSSSGEQGPRPGTPGQGEVVACLP